MTQQSKGSRTKERWLIKFGGVSTGGLDLRPTSPAGLRLRLDPLLEVLVKGLASDTHIQQLDSCTMIGMISSELGNAANKPHWTRVRGLLGLLTSFKV